MGPPTIQPSASYISLILSHRTFTYRSNGWIRMRISYQRSKLIILSIILSLILPTKCSIVTLLFHISVLLRDFLFGRWSGTRTHKRQLLCLSYLLNDSSNLCHTNSIVVHSIIELVCTMWHTQYGFILTTQY